MGGWEFSIIDDEMIIGWVRCGLGRMVGSDAGQLVWEGGLFRFSWMGKYGMDLIGWDSPDELICTFFIMLACWFP